jgi:hypothetical protein
LQTDRPIQSAAEDRFDRAPFARRIAEVIRNRRDPATLVVGLYGPWGDGKSSTLSLIKEALGASEDVVQVDYNPWFFSSSTENLTRSFFLTLGDALEKTKLFSRDRIGGLLKKYGGMVPKFGSILKAAGDALSVTDLKAIRGQVEEILARHRTPIVVFVDDIDRLDRKEIQTLFKLIRLAADFPYVIYVLAFDDEIVAAALGEAYEEGDAAAGRRFLEKIVQSPLHMPRASPQALRTMAFEGVEAILKANDIQLTEQQTYAYGNNFVMSFEALMATPRQAKLYENALTFAVPILKSEVNMVDLLLLEGVRTFIPRLYLVIRDNPDLFLKRSQGDAKTEALFKAVLEDAYRQTGIDGRQQEAVRNNVLEKLFPRSSSMGYGDEWDRIWAKEKRICAPDYFARYFRYGVPTGDVPDVLIDQVIADAVAQNLPALNEHFAAVASQAAHTIFLRKLRGREGDIPAAAVLPLITAIASAAKAFPREAGGMTFSDWTIMQSAILTSHLAQRLPPAEQAAAAQVAIEKSTSFIYSVNILQWTRRYKDKGETYGFLEEDRIKELAGIITERLVVAAGDAPLYRYLEDDTSRVLLPWSWYGDTADLKARVGASIGKEGADGAEALIQVCAGRSWELTSGIPHVSDVRADVYRTIARFVDPEVIMAALKARYGAKLDAPEFYSDRDTPLGERLAEQFAFIHLKPPAQDADNANAEEKDDEDE